MPYEYVIMSMSIYHGHHKKMEILGREAGWKKGFLSFQMEGDFWVLKYEKPHWEDFDLTIR